MAASTATVALSSSVVAAPSSLSSRTSFAPQVVSVAPCKAARRGVVMVRASAGEEPKNPARRELLAGLVAAGAALAVAGSSIASTTTAKQADDLLKAGDTLSNNESPPRFGGERVGQQALKNADKVAQQAGSGAVKDLQNNQDAGSKALDAAKENVEKAGERLGNLFKPNNTSGKLSTNSIEDATSNLKGGVEDLLSNGPEKVKSDVDTAKGKVTKDVATIRGLGSRNKAGNGFGEAQDKASSAVKEGEGLFGDIKKKITDSFPN